MNPDFSSSPTLSSSRRGGFTLIEVLVSSAITLIVMSMLFTVLLGAMNAWQLGTARLQTNADARMALDILTQDLQSLVARQTNPEAPQEWLVSDLVGIPGTSGLQSTHLLFFAPSVDREPGQDGDIVAISYRVGFQDPLANSNDRRFWIFGLYKKMADTRTTFLDALGQTDIRGGFWNSRNTVRDRDLLIPNVVDFQVNWVIRTQNGTEIEEDGVVLRNRLFRPGGREGIRIEAADISLTIVSEEGARRIQTLAAGGEINADRLAPVIREHGRVFTQRVRIDY